MSRFGATARMAANIGRNDLCPCGSGRKYKRCCQAKDARVEMPAAAQRAPSASRHRLAALTAAAKAHYDVQRWAEAIPLFLEIVSLDPKNAAAYLDLGVAFLACGRSAEAVASLQRATELQPSNERALTHLGAALLRRGANPKPWSSFES